MLTITEIDGIVEIIVEKVGPERIILFGAYADSSQDDDSDLDLFIEMKTDLSRNKRAVEIRKHLYGKVSVTKDIIVYTPEEISEWEGVTHSFVDNVLTKGRLMYEK